jgi:cysteine desulfurase
MHANNETGILFPLEKLARLTKETDSSIIFHTDATQTMGKLPLDLESGDLKHVDMLSFSGHKLHAPKGVGALFVRKGTPCRPYLIGGHQEAGRRGGTENVAFIVGLARALELARENEADEARVQALRDDLEARIVDRIPCVQVNGSGVPRLPNTLNVSCHFVEGEGMLYQLSAQGICASSGSACTSGSLEPSHVLRAMKVPFTAVHGSVRFSLSRYNTQGDVDRIVEVFPKVVENLRRVSPYWDSDKNEPRPEALSMLETPAE